jgi:excisionase family DNA binding protein
MLSVKEAAHRLGVNPQRVRALIAENRLPAQLVGGAYVLDPGAVAAFAQVPRVRGRPLSARSAWALLAELSGHDGPVLSSRSEDRVRALLRQKSDAIIRSLVHSEPRSELYRWRVLEIDLKRLMNDPTLVPSGLAADNELVSVRYDPIRDGLDSYVSGDRLKELERRIQPSQDSDKPNLLLRAPLESSWILEEKVAPPAVAAADLLVHSDPRVRRAGNDAIRRLVNSD